MPVQPGHPAGDEPRDHRRREPDEADGPRHGHRERGQHHREQHADHPRAPDVEPQHGRGVVAEREHVQPPGPRDGDERDEQDGRRGLRDLLRAGLDDRALAPREHARGLLLEQQHEQVRHGGQREHRRGAGEHEARRPLRPAAGDDEHEPRGREPAEEGQRAGGRERQREPERGGRHDGRVRARVDRERVRRGQRVAGDGLQHAARDAERRAHEQARGHARGARRDEHRQRLVVAGPDEQPQQVPEPDPRGAEREVDEREGDDRDEADQQHRRDPRRSCATAGRRPVEGLGGGRPRVEGGGHRPTVTA